ncbi:MAG: flagella basal body P-ring formation protein FlgA [Thermoguttaceae bacterium]|nr:flagella basal body P-ring formation protein FlgA [Thermoguttaceae bacterium]MDW8079449.1 flagella basal body P-ring formation protein FlgA [Thermoguttaceae bacterium]
MLLRLFPIRVCRIRIWSRAQKVKPAALLLALSLLGTVWGQTGDQANCPQIKLIFRSTAVCSNPVVTIGDLAEIAGTMPELADRLRAEELFPAPQEGSGILVSRQQLLELIAARGYDRRQFSVDGAREVWLVRRAENSLRPEATAAGPCSRLGEGKPPVAEPRRAVTWPIGKVPGTTTGATEGASTHSAYGNAGRAISPSKAGRHVSPLVERGQLVNVFVYGEHVSIRTVAKAREDGALGDEITVEALPTKVPYRARVSGPQTVVVDLIGGRAKEAAENRPHYLGGGQPGETQLQVATR